MTALLESGGIALWWAGLMMVLSAAFLSLWLVLQLPRLWPLIRHRAASFSRLPRIERWLLLVFVCGMIQYASTKGTATEWETNGMASCASLPSTNDYEVMSASGSIYAKAYRDLNRNGQFDADADIFLVRQVPALEAVSYFVLAFGDVDNDGVSDQQERTDGTDPYDAKNYCFNWNIWT